MFHSEDARLFHLGVHLRTKVEMWTEVGFIVEMNWYLSVFVLLLVCETQTYLCLCSSSQGLLVFGRKYQAGSW